MEIRVSGQGAYRTEHHVVWIPTYRRRILNPGVAADLSALFPKLLRQVPGVEIVVQNIQVDHIHTVMSIPPRYAVSEVIGRLKGQTASLLRKQFAWLSKVYWAEHIVWSPGYCVSTVGIDEAKIIRDVEYQQRQDSGQVQLELF